MMFKVLRGDVALTSDRRGERAQVAELVAVIPALVIRTGGENEDEPGGSLGQSEGEGELAAVLADGEPGHREWWEDRALGGKS